MKTLLVVLAAVFVVASNNAVAAAASIVLGRIAQIRPAGDKAAVRFPAGTEIHSGQTITVDVAPPKTEDYFEDHERVCRLDILDTPVLNPNLKRKNEVIVIVGFDHCKAKAQLKVNQVVKMSYSQDLITYMRNEHREPSADSIPFTKEDSTSASSEHGSVARSFPFGHEFYVSSSSGSISFAGSASEIKLTSGASMSVADGFQLGLTSSWDHLSDGAGTTTNALIILAGPTINLPMDTDIRNSFFIRIGLGLTVASVSSSKITSGSATKFTVSGEFGKRFKMFENLSYSPSFGVLNVDSLPTTFVFSLFSFAVVF